MSKRTRQCIGILFAIVAYYIIHEGAHLVMALMFHAFKKLNFLWMVDTKYLRKKISGKLLSRVCDCCRYFALQTEFNNKKLCEIGKPVFTEFFCDDLCI